MVMIVPYIESLFSRNSKLRETEVKGMAERIIEMRSVLYDKLTHELKTPGDWGHIKSQIGMFRYISSNHIQRKVD